MATLATKGNEMKASIGKPKKFDVQIFGQRPGGLGGLGGVFIQDHGQWPTLILLMEELQGPQKFVTAQG